MISLLKNVGFNFFHTNVAPIFFENCWFNILYSFLCDTFENVCSEHSHKSDLFIVILMIYDNMINGTITKLFSMSL
jgi:hypothetical protein